MSGRRKLGMLAIAASVSTFGILQQSAFAQQPKTMPGLSDTPVASPNTEQMRLATIARDNSRKFGSDPDDPGPLATDLSPAFRPQAVSAAIRKVGDWELANYGQYFTTIDKSRLLDGRIWTWSALYAGYMAAADTLHEGKYRDAMRGVGNAYHWGFITPTPNADNLSIAQMYTEMYMIDKKPEELAPTTAATDNILAAPRVELNSGKRIEWWWCDALFMAPPVWSRMYAITGDKKYTTYLDEEWAKTSSLLYDEQAHLYARDASFIGKKEKNGEKIFWSRGEGWVMGGLARTLQYLPKNDSRRAFYVTQLQQMSAAVAKLQGSDGLWHSSLLDPADYPVEISGSAFMTFGMAWGINNGILDRKTYTPVVEKAWAGMLKHIYADGRLGDIQQTGAQPSTYKASASYNYGVGGFLLAGSEIYKMSAMKHGGRKK